MTNIKKKYYIFSVEWWILLLLLYYAQHTIIRDRPSWLFGSFILLFILFLVFYSFDYYHYCAASVFFFLFYCISPVCRWMGSLSLSISTLISFPLPYIYFSIFYFIFFYFLKLFYLLLSPCKYCRWLRRDVTATVC
jgi:hypothetical protein